MKAYGPLKEHLREAVENEEYARKMDRALLVVLCCICASALYLATTILLLIFRAV